MDGWMERERERAREKETVTDRERERYIEREREKDIIVRGRLDVSCCPKTQNLQMC